MNLVRYEAARVALKEARRVDEAKDIHDKAEAVRAYARQVNDTEMVSWASEIKLRAMRRMGELLKNGQAAGEIATAHRPKEVSGMATLKGLGVTRDASSLSQKIAAVPQEEFEAHLDELREQHKEITVAGVERLAAGVGAHVSHNSGDNEWYTPKEYVEAARKVMGGIDLDPASTAEANAVIKAERYFTIEDNGLVQPWAGRIWMNPPYASDLIHEFITKLCGVSDEIVAACVLVNNATETQWFQLLAGFSDAVAFPKGRVKFWHPQKVSATPLQGQAVLYMGDRTESFLDTFSKFGVVCDIR